MKVIEFTGTPKSGKSALVKRLIDYLGEEKVSPVYEGYRMCPFKDKKGAHFEQQIWVIFSIVNKILEFKNSGTESKPEFLILDRGLWDQIVFINLLKEKGLITARQYRELSLFLKPFLSLTDLIFSFETDPQISQQRQKEEGKKPRFTLKDLTLMNKIAKDLLPPSTIHLDGSKTKEELLREIVKEVGL
ncbi:hypothetical protein A2686_02215 [Candidatus Woesebacteria bacterium RIFCSPHIGHO2_01_FULL_38_10]|uniref:Uncharacterized protein n=1 Tax=Candidatus Woesebacteria bacterium RIFCSPLOWO2_01_FULL_39_10b TaxID=1802517 RepID=A0A1F8B9S4_9BACT|nr:MAG: hypothetical protein A2686_02215 [Candidatus Woesebacteria bacterium RIFCSPHIGHO2_01_FULL_38_10]OGM60792.1 MAG: hypothetical protein A2892_01985 [Candidatus Woesebacteria bacterium RIFCSPLOWO2_01_FULL_39_10b]